SEGSPESGSIFGRSGHVVLVVVWPAGRAVPGGSGFLACADAGGPAGAGAGFGDAAAKVSLPAPAAQSHGSVRALVRLAAGRASSCLQDGPGKRTRRSLILLALWPRALAPDRVAA